MNGIRTIVAEPGKEYQDVLLCKPVDAGNAPDKIIVTRSKELHPLVAPKYDRRWEYRKIFGWGVDDIVQDALNDGWRIATQDMLETVYA